MVDAGIIEINNTDCFAQEPLVSVIMITYNHQNFIAQAIEGVLKQRAEFPFELIIGEDCSTDKTREIVLKYQQENPGLIRVLVPETNLGMHENFIRSLAAAKGQYVALCEGDDYWCNPDKLRIQVNLLQQDEESVGVFHDCHILNDETSVMAPRIGSRQLGDRHDLESIIRENNIATASMLFKKFDMTPRFLEKFRSTNKGDYMLALLVGEQGIWRYLPQIMSVYRVHAGGVWSGEKVLAICEQNASFYGLFVNDPRYKFCRETILQKRKNAVRQLAAAYADEGAFEKSLKAYFRSIGSRRKLLDHYMTSSKYWKTFLKNLAVRVGFERPARKVWHIVRR
jgi:glycosyltransferase involved in cell wall biosynthesis